MPPRTQTPEQEAPAAAPPVVRVENRAAWPQVFRTVSEDRTSLTIPARSTVEVPRERWDELGKLPIVQRLIDERELYPHAALG